jgi:hypothetical protein
LRSERLTGLELQVENSDPPSQFPGEWREVSIIVIAELVNEVKDKLEDGRTEVRKSLLVS